MFASSISKGDTQYLGFVCEVSVPLASASHESYGSRDGDRAVKAGISAGDCVSVDCGRDLERAGGRNARLKREREA